jgi:hypothetical protein
MHVSIQSVDHFPSAVADGSEVTNRDVVQLRLPVTKALMQGCLTALNCSFKNFAKTNPYDLTPAILGIISADLIMNYFGRILTVLHIKSIFYF